MKKKWDNIKVQNAFLQWRCGNVDKKVSTLEKDDELEIKTVAEAAQQNISPLSHSEEVAFSKH